MAANLVHTRPAKPFQRKDLPLFPTLPLAFPEDTRRLIQFGSPAHSAITTRRIDKLTQRAIFSFQITWTNLEFLKEKKKIDFPPLPKKDDAINKLEEKTLV